MPWRKYEENLKNHSIQTHRCCKDNNTKSSMMNVLRRSMSSCWSKIITGKNNIDDFYKVDLLIPKVCWEEVDISILFIRVSLYFLYLQSFTIRGTKHVISDLDLNAEGNFCWVSFETKSFSVRIILIQPLFAFFQLRRT